ncbi:MAG TPA: hypothetical protein VJW23_16765, partial [Propionibacteriaceae bacterium]|nr:hypothetical protein [Propionibacteriaceae bacterium]
MGHLQRITAEPLPQLRLVREGQLEGETGKNPGTQGTVPGSERVKRFLEKQNELSVDDTRLHLRLPEPERGQRELLSVSTLPG